MLHFLWGSRPTPAAKCPFHRFIRFDGSPILVRLSAINTIIAADELAVQQGTRSYIHVSGHFVGLANSPESVLEAVWHRDGDHV